MCRMLMNCRLFFIACIVAITVVGPSQASEWYDPSPFGVNGLKLMHSKDAPNVFDDAKKTAKLMKDAGIYWDRLELWWGVIEPEPGRFDWTYADKVADFYREQNIHGTVILCYSSAWSKTPPRDSAERERYAEYVYQVVSRYKDIYKVWEIWNEPNIPGFWPEPNVEHYTLMLKDAYKAAKRADPTCTILAACTSGPGNDFIRGIYRHGGWDYLDGISIHPYSTSGGPIPQRLDRILRNIQDIIRSTGKPKSLWITEMGWIAYDPESEAEQAVYLFQSYVISLANGVKKFFWFDFADWGEKWGLVRGIDPFDPKPSYLSYALATRTLGSPGEVAFFEGYLRMPAGIACYVFKRSVEQKTLILWSNDDLTRKVQLPRKGSLSAIDIFGGRVSVNGGMLSVGPTPIIVTAVNCPSYLQSAMKYNPYRDWPGKNLLNNGTLEILSPWGPRWWAPGRYDRSARDGEFAVSTGGRRSSKCVSISQSGSRAAYDSCLIPVVSNGEYRLTAWLKTQSACGANQIGLAWYSGCMSSCLGEVRSGTITGTHDWTKVTLAAHAPDDAAFVRANLISESNPGKAWFDDIVLVEE